MIIQSAASALAPQDTAATSRSIQHDDGGVAASFAGLLASVLFAQPTPQRASVSQADGTSELEQQADNPNADATGSAGDSKDAKDAADPTNPALPAAALASTNEIVRSIGALDPALQAKLARVAQRVEQETGHSLTVQETFRTQARQDALYAQGRDTTGPVVTWTHNSQHTLGRAVDVTLDGNAGPDAYSALQRIAQEEGLRTLGARDPGHLELPRAGTSAIAPLNVPSAPADATSSGAVGLSQLARIAPLAVPNVAHVARVAQVAQVAHVAQVGQTSHVAADSRVAQPTQASKPGAAAPANASVNSQTLGGRSAGRDSTNDNGGQTPNDSRNGYAALGGTFSTRDHNGSFADTQSIAAPASAAADHVERAMNVMDNAPARHLSQITMSVDSGNGTTDRVQVAMRGSSLSSTIDAADKQGAQAMSARSEELVRALNRDGIEVDSLRVRAAAERPANTVTAAASTQTANTSADAQSHSRFNRGDAWQQQQDQQQRRQAQQERRQQRQQRGGNTQ